MNVTPHRPDTMPLPRLAGYVLLLLALLTAAGCQSDQTAADAAAPPNGLYPEPITTPAQSDPFAQPGVLNTPPDRSAPAAVFTAPQGNATPGGTYQVQRGETLWAIAQRVYGNGQRYKDIAAANPGLDPNRIREGQVINLP